MGEIKTFTDLNAWRESYKMVLLIYKITDNFPGKEDFALTSQMRRAAVSVSSNIAEGFSRRSNKEKIQFYHMSLGSITELQNQLLIAKGVGYLKEVETKEVDNQLVVAHKLVNGLIKGVTKLHNT
jgi:four helix bundle protein